jgi:hypothetical protein
MRLSILLAALLSAATSSAIADVKDSSSERALSLPNGTPAIIIQKEGWLLQQERRRQGDTAVYYLLSNERSQLNFSVYIDKTESCQDAATCLKSALKNPSYKDAKEFSETEIGLFKAVQFYTDQPNGMAIKQAHILASAYVDGQWFDVHISKAGKERPEIGPLIEFLRTVAVR